jgi:hypothetical protein
MRQFMLAFVTFALAVSFAGCAVVDPGDYAVLKDKLGTLTPEQQTKLEIEGKRRFATDKLDEKLGTSETERRPENFRSYTRLTCPTSDGGEKVFEFVAEQIRREIRYGFHDFKWANVFASLFDWARTQRVYLSDPDVDFSKCRWTHSPELVKAMEAIDEGLAEIDAKNAEDGELRVSNETIAYLIAGAIAVGVVAVIAPELLPILCTLGADVYCEDSTPGTTPPAPIPTTPPDPDAP